MRLDVSHPLGMHHERIKLCGVRDIEAIEGLERVEMLARQSGNFAIEAVVWIDILKLGLEKRTDEAKGNVSFEIFRDFLDVACFDNAFDLAGRG